MKSGHVAFIVRTIVRLLWPLMALWLACITVALVNMYYSIAHGFQPQHAAIEISRLLLSGAVILTVILSIAILPYRCLRLAQRAMRSKYQLCERCWYDMHGVPGAKKCPECGKPYDRRQTMRRWREFSPNGLRRWWRNTRA